MFDIFKKKKPASEPTKEEVNKSILESLGAINPFKRRASEDAMVFEAPVGAAGVAMDSAAGYGLKSNGMASYGIPEAQMDWYASQTWIGYNMSAMLAQHWLIDKACNTPARDAIRQGYEIQGEGELPEKLKEFDKQYALNKNMREMIHYGRVFGVRYVLFRVKHTDPEYYQKPFNIDAVKRGMYEGMSQIDPQWVIPEPSMAALQDPASPIFYEPEFFRIGQTIYHRSHFHIFIPHPVVDVLKPRYQYGGVSVPQRIYERVYAAERTANEAPQLMMTKRLMTIKLSDAALANPDSLDTNLAAWSALRDNYGVLATGQGEEVQQHDTGLADVDAVTMTQYQLVASASNVPATKLLGTSPKGFNASGDYEESSYREELESIQTNDLLPMIEKHHMLVKASEGLTGETKVSFEPLDSPTASEWATINASKAASAKTYFDAGAIDGVDIRNALAKDKNSDFYGLEPMEEDLIDDLLTDETEQVAPKVG